MSQDRFAAGCLYSCGARREVRLCRTFCSPVTLTHSMINEQECVCVQPDTEKGLPSTSRDLKCVYNIMREAK